MASEAVILAEAKNAELSDSAIVVAKDDFNEEERYIVPQCKVSGERDRG